MGLARALAGKPLKCLILDEVSSALDVESEQCCDGGDQTVLKVKMTIIAIAHRLSTIRHALIQSMLWGTAK